MKLRGSQVVESIAPCMDLLTTDPSTLRDKRVLRTAFLNHREENIIDRLEGWALAGIVESLLVGNCDLIADAIVNFCLPI